MEDRKITFEMLRDIRKHTDERVIWVIENSDEAALRDIFHGLDRAPFTTWERFEELAVDAVRATLYDDDYIFYDWETIGNHMDDELREQLHNSRKWKSNKEFYDAYCELHKEKFGEEFEVN